MNNSEEYYDNLACVYDEATNKEGVWTPPDVVYNSIRGYLTKNSRIFDFGIGTGKSIAPIFKSNDQADIYGVDISSKMLTICKRIYPKVKTSKIEKISDIRNISGKYDVIISSGAIEFVEEIEELIDCLFDLAADGGILSITYEPVIAFHPIQSEHMSLTVSSQDCNFHVDNFYTYRHDPSYFNNILLKTGFKILTDSEFVAYEKSDNKIIYHLVVAEKKLKK